MIDYAFPTEEFADLDPKFLKMLENIIPKLAEIYRDDRTLACDTILAVEDAIKEGHIEMEAQKAANQPENQEK